MVLLLPAHAAATQFMQHLSISAIQQVSFLFLLKC
jgi:hypothetical protein